MSFSAHFLKHYDSHASAITAAGVSLFSGIEDRLTNILWSVITGLAVFGAVQGAKWLFKVK